MKDEILDVLNMACRELGISTKGGMKIIKFNSVEEVVSYVIEPN